MLIEWRNTVLKTDNITLVFEYFLNQIEANQTFKNEYLHKKFDFISLADDSRSIALQDVYGTMNNYNFDNLQLKYADDKIGLIQNRIMKSGLRTAKLLNDLFDERAKNKDDFFFGIGIFILILLLIMIIFTLVMLSVKNLLPNFLMRRNYSEI